jgi:hypothetical protein
MITSMRTPGGVARSARCEVTRVLVVARGLVRRGRLLYFAAVCATRRWNVERGESPLRWAVVAARSKLGAA